MSQIQQCYIGLGSNLGDSRQTLKHAVQQLEDLGTIHVSRLYSSPPMGPQDQPNYLNAVVNLQTTLEPLALLDELQRIENESGRVRLRHWGERTLDLDLLLYATLEINHPRLTVPHVGLLLRDFVILPLLDLAPDMQVNQQNLRELPCIQQATAKVIADSDWYH
ncbi:2-amino-4-hydroxy-6-hydroxymethyldihydropteridine diphosphokinase [Acinetobacter qingfengensis]|uniref:2-amino-4-hydroxy-6-hydroxymethyldihydropteridine pyrophosphokinase n=1 Tax=Acinetobacter qingfengensis TaxID=1262585 RepID=A0A1E7QXJ2_9GAMM|nr:2-amino-4-hydroxy-6-hydroxymethyldihydropteridine diphosphokinase [Acinetobacter qingfengensis]KAA8731623.1 2-amino-4-hydroxy-6-hydroxymethyldihydropteridine diphosphokinase [Acinetobacter qingfengensis]OEY91726.1 2-amino-4-hydroxy-6-hydroxymethyldihydropteridine diphosphokinase [Acinetobacter qingfengensis]